MRRLYHKEIAVSYEHSGRTAQKARTRDALVAAVRELMAAGVSPTVEEAAARASVSRATAYRYFPNQRALVAAAYPEIEAESLLGDDAPDDLEERLDRVVDEILEITLASETELRAMLRISLETGPREDGELPLRKGRRVIWVEDALAPLEAQLDRREFRRVVHAIAAAVGIDSLVWLVDVAGLTREEACETMRWSVHALLRGAVP